MGISRIFRRCWYIYRRAPRLERKELSSDSQPLAWYCRSALRDA